MHHLHRLEMCQVQHFASQSLQQCPSIAVGSTAHPLAGVLLNQLPDSEQRQNSNVTATISVKKAHRDKMYIC